MYEFCNPARKSTPYPDTRENILVLGVPNRSARVEEFLYGGRGRTEKRGTQVTRKRSRLVFLYRRMERIAGSHSGIS